MSFTVSGSRPSSFLPKLHKSRVFIRSNKSVGILTLEIGKFLFYPQPNVIITGENTLPFKETEI